MPKTEILHVLENALRLGGTTLVRNAASHRLVPIRDAVTTGNADVAGSSPEPGHDISV